MIPGASPCGEHGPRPGPREPGSDGILIPTPHQDAEAWVTGNAGRDGADLLRELAAKDIFALRDRCPRWLKERALLVWPPRLLEASLVEVAGDLSLGVPGLPLDLWIEERIERAAQRVLRTDAARSPEEGVGPDHAFLRSCFGTPAGKELEAAVRFNALPDATRQVFFLAVVDARPLGEIAESLRAELLEMAEMVAEGLFALAATEEEDRARLVWELMESATLGGGQR